MTWFHDAFGEDYLTVYDYRDEGEAATFLTSFERTARPPAGAWILDLACGAGRFSVLLALRGYRLVGLDLSKILLVRARREARRRGAEVALVRGDMRWLPWRERFDAVLSMFSSFGYFESDDQNRLVIAAMKQVLRPGGRVVLDFLNPAYVRRHVRQSDETRKNGVQVVQSRRIDETTNRVVKQIAITDARGRREYKESIRLYDRAFIAQAFTDLGFRVEAVLGDYEFRDFTDDSKRMIFLARKQ